MSECFHDWIEDCGFWYCRYCGVYSGAPRRPTKPAHASDCAVHNAPAFEAGECDCGAEAEKGAE